MLRVGPTAEHWVTRQPNLKALASVGRGYDRACVQNPSTCGREWANFPALMEGGHCSMDCALAPSKRLEASGRTKEWSLTRFHQIPRSHWCEFGIAQPERFVRKPLTPPPLPAAAWINPPFQTAIAADLELFAFPVALWCPSAMTLPFCGPRVPWQVGRPPSPGRALVWVWGPELSLGADQGRSSRADRSRRVRSLCAPSASSGSPLARATLAA